MLKRALLELGLLGTGRRVQHRARVTGGTARVDVDVDDDGDGDGSSLVGALPRGLSRVDLEGRALARVLARSDRVSFLADLLAHLAAEGTIAIATATTVAEGVSPWGRLLLDGPRSLFSRFGLPEPGTRFTPASAHHMYYASTEIADEAWEAGLAERDHRAGIMTLVRRAPSDARPPRPRLDHDLRILTALGRAERLRRRAPREALTLARSAGRHEEVREHAARRRLHARIGWLDGFVPPRPNCFRRVLAETLLDGGAAREVVVLSLDVASTGHAHFPSDPQGVPKAYDVAFEV